MMTRALPRAFAIAVATLLAVSHAQAKRPTPTPKPLPLTRALFLGGSSGSHRPAQMAQFAAILEGDEISIDYTENVGDLNPEKLAGYKTVIIYKDDGELPPENEAALLDFVESGKGIVALHCASHCFRNSAAYTKLIGGRFMSHGGEVFRARVIDAQHPAMRDVKSFNSWDETYVHNELSGDNRVLMAREHEEGYEPYAWVRHQGKGRVFYTALGHDERTWSRPEFHALLASAILWAGGAVEDEKPTSAPPEDYLTAEPPAPLSPEESMKTMHMPEGFGVELFAAEPEITKPIAMTFDARGRAWIIESVDYPNIVNADAKGEDRIKICEDTDGDGRADKFTIYAEGLNIPTSLVHAGGGVIVAAPPDLLLLRDTNGDDVADERKVLFTGFGRSDTHAVMGNLRYGLDNWIWATCGYSGGKVKVGESEIRFSACVFRFKPDGSAFEVITPTESNTWGLGFMETGEILVSKANDAHQVQVVIPNRFYESVRGWHGVGNASIADHKVFHPVTKDVRQVDWFNGYTAACGDSVYTARAFPKEYWNRAAFVCEPTGHLIHIDWIGRDGSGLVARDGWNLMASTDPWCAPIEAVVGPDAAVWFIDWYSYIVRHNPTPPGFETGKGNAYVTSQRETKNGRIYRIKAAGGNHAPAPNLEKATSEELVAALGHDNMWARLQAQRLLVEKRDSLAVSLLADGMKHGTGLFQSDAGTIHALWTMAGLRGNTPESNESATLRVALRSAPAVRKAALQAAPRNSEARDSAHLDALIYSPGIDTSDGGVELARLLALAETPGAASASGYVIQMLMDEGHAKDRWISDAATAAAARDGEEFLIAVLGHDDSKPPSPALLQTCAIVAEHLARGPEPEESLGVIGRLHEGSAEVALSILKGLDAGWPEGRAPKLDDATQEKLAASFSSLPAEAQAHMASLVSRWGVEGKLKEAASGLRGAMVARVADANLTDEQRIDAAKLLLKLDGGAEAAGAALDQITPQASPEFAAGIVGAVGEVGTSGAAEAILARWGTLTPASRPTAVAALLRRPDAIKGLLDAVANGEIRATELTLEQRQQLLRHKDAAISVRAKALFAKGTAASDDIQALVDRLLPLAERHGDAARGKEVFEKNCKQCHRFNGEGNFVGPELTGLAARPRADILIDILDPNRSVEGNYLQWIVETTKGESLTGRLVSESKTAIEILDAQAQRRAIQREEIKELRQSRLSMMPEGLDEIGEADLPSLLDYLTARGKFVQLPIARAATASSAAGMFIDRKADVERLIFPEWGAVEAFGVPFHVADPQGGDANNAILLYGGPEGTLARRMPKRAEVPCNSPAKAIHLLGGVAGWGFPLGQEGSLSMRVRLRYAGGETEDHLLRNGVEIADYIRVVDVPGSKLAFKLRGQQLRYLAIAPRKADMIEAIEFIKGEDDTAPLIMAATAEAP